MATDPVRQLVQALDKTQWFEREAFAMHQQRLLSRMLLHAANQTARYAEVLAPLIDDQTVDLGRWDDIAFLTRAEAQNDPGAITAKNTPADSGGVSEAATSGSTARAFPHLRSDLLVWLSSALTERGHAWFDTDFSGTLASIRTYDSEAASSESGEIRRGGWQSGGKVGTYAMIGLETGTHVQHRWLDDLRPDYLSTYPSIAVALAKTFHGQAWPKSVKRIFCVGETLTQEQRTEVMGATGIPMTDSYGSSETGLLAFECPQSGLMHIMAEAAVVEIVGPDDRPVGPGQIGEVAITSLVNFAMPFIRYKIGDYAETADGPCPCGRTLPALKRILGRSRNMFKRPDGSYVWPNVLSRVFNEFIPHRQFRFVQKSATGVELIYVPRDENQSEDRAAMLAYARERLFAKVELTYTRASEIARHGSGKFEDYICEID